MTPLFWTNPTPHFTPVSAAYTKWPNFLDNLNLKNLARFARILTRFDNFMVELINLFGTVNVTQKFWMSEGENQMLGWEMQKFPLTQPPWPKSWEWNFTPESAQILNIMKIIFWE